MVVGVMPTSVACNGVLVQSVAAAAVPDDVAVVAFVAAAVVLLSFREQPAATTTTATSTDSQVDFLMNPPLLSRQVTSQACDERYTI